MTSLINLNLDRQLDEPYQVVKTWNPVEPFAVVAPDGMACTFPTKDDAQQFCNTMNKSERK